MLATEAPFPQYFDTDGDPLDGGQLYFGLPNQNPQTAPIPVYWDAAGTQPAVQPIRTLNGYAARGGTPAVVFVGGDYSISVINARGMPVYYAGSAAGLINDVVFAQFIADLADATDPTKGDAMVAVQQPGDGAAARTQHDKNSERISIEDYYTGSYHTALQSALAHLATIGGGVIEFLTRTYDLTGHRIDIQGISNITFECNGATLLVCSSVDETPIIMNNSTNVRWRGANFDGRFAETAFGTNFINADGCTNCALDDCTFRNHSGFSLIFSNGADNHIRNCRTFGTGVVDTGLHSGFMLGGETRSSIESCWVYNIAVSLGAESFPIELKNDNDDSHIVDSHIRNCTKGFYVGSDNPSPTVGNGSNNCTISGSAVNCRSPLFVQASRRCYIDLSLDQGGVCQDVATSPYMVNVAGFNDKLSMTLRLFNPDPLGTAIYNSGSDEVYIDVAYFDHTGGGLVKFDVGVQRCRVNVNAVRTNSVGLNLLDLTTDLSSSTGADTNVVDDRRNFGGAGANDTGAALYFPVKGQSRTNNGWILDALNNRISARIANATKIRVDATEFGPGFDNALAGGNASRRYTQLFAATTTIGSSDGREKAGRSGIDLADPWLVDELTSAEMAAAKDLARAIGIYKFRASANIKGDGARLHIGLTVQRAIAIMISHGLDPFAYAFICYDEWPQEPPRVEEVDGVLVEVEPGVPAGNRFGFRDTELHYFVLRGLEARLTALESA